MKKDAEEYRMKVHLFRAASSPGCANYGFKKAADDGEIRRSLLKMLLTLCEETFMSTMD